jgi:CSLREA domain-containing protein
MTSTNITTNANRYFRALIALMAALSLAASLLLSQAAELAEASTTFTVNTKTDAADTNPGDGTCSILGSFCTLRAAVQEANVTPGADTIKTSTSAPRGTGWRPSPPTRPCPHNQYGDHRRLHPAGRVLHGNHRVSVARYHGVEMIDAEVTEFRAGSSVGNPKRPVAAEGEARHRHGGGDGNVAAA